MLIKKKNCHQETTNVRESLEDRKQIGLKLRPTYTQEITSSSQTIDANSWRGSSITVRVLNRELFPIRVLEKEMREMIEENIKEIIGEHFP